MDPRRDEACSRRNCKTKIRNMQRLRVLRGLAVLQVRMSDARENHACNKLVPNRQMGSSYRDTGFQSNANESAGILSSSDGSYALSVQFKTTASSFPMAENPCHTPG